MLMNGFKWLVECRDKNPVPGSVRTHAVGCTFSKSGSLAEPSDVAQSQGKAPHFNVPSPRSSCPFCPSPLQQTSPRFLLPTTTWRPRSLTQSTATTTTRHRAIYLKRCRRSVIAISKFFYPPKRSCRGFKSVNAGRLGFLSTTTAGRRFGATRHSEIDYLHHPTSLTASYRQSPIERVVTAQSGCSL
ncbi:hypothetical protein K449DRAFT_73339 [Hypoxylon sp. EC38]|nr:hypothetical protein K449DRAFT_73339 [Hypoxylon sp. EC38]